MSGSGVMLLVLQPLLPQANNPLLQLQGNMRVALFPLTFHALAASAALWRPAKYGKPKEEQDVMPLLKLTTVDIKW